MGTESNVQKTAKRRKRNYILVAFIVILLLLAIGYASFTQVLNLSGTVAGNANWEVIFIDGETTDKNDNVVKGTISNDGHTLTVNVNDLKYAGDARAVTAVIKNNSSMPVKLTSFVPVGPTNPDITFDFINLNGTNEKIDAGGTCTYTFVVGWDVNSTATSIGGATNGGNYSFAFTYEQDLTTATELSPSHSH